MTYSIGQTLEVEHVSRVYIYKVVRLAKKADKTIVTVLDTMTGKYLEYDSRGLDVFIGA